jgi:hypothetical protein
MEETLAESTILRYFFSMMCFHCGKETGLSEFVGRGDTCPHCRSDARVCKNCGFYDPKVYNECREPQADRIVEKEKSNFCDFFLPGGGKGAKTKPDPKAAAEALFKKK